MKRRKNKMMYANEANVKSKNNSHYNQELDKISYAILEATQQGKFHVVIPVEGEYLYSLKKQLEEEYHYYVEQVQEGYYRVNKLEIKW
jgi:hypothetical protein